MKTSCANVTGGKGSWNLGLGIKMMEMDCFVRPWPDKKVSDLVMLHFFHVVVYPFPNFHFNHPSPSTSYFSRYTQQLSNNFDLSMHVGYCSIFKPFIWLNLFNFGKLFLPTTFGKLLIILVKPLLNITGPRHRSVLMYVYYICNGKEIKNVISNAMEKKERNREKLIRCKRTCKWRRCEKSLIFNKKILIYILYSAWHDLLFL